MRVKNWGVSTQAFKYDNCTKLIVNDRRNDLFRAQINLKFLKKIYFLNKFCYQSDFWYYFLPFFWSEKAINKIILQKNRLFHSAAINSTNRLNNYKCTHRMLLCSKWNINHPRSVRTMHYTLFKLKRKMAEPISKLLAEILTLFRMDKNDCMLYCSDNLYTNVCMCVLLFIRSLLFASNF